MTPQNRLLLTVNDLNHSDPREIVELLIAYQPAKFPCPGPALDAARLLEAKGFITREPSSRLEENRLRITPTGVQEAERLRLPFWRRWASDKTLVRQVITGCIGAVIGACGTELVRQLFKLLPWL
jgi:hypothetical protein